MFRAVRPGPPGKLASAALILSGLPAEGDDDAEEHDSAPRVVSAGEFFSEDDEDTDCVVPEVWSCNWLAVEIFEHCDMEGFGAGMAGIFWTGISVTQIHTARQVIPVPEAEWIDLVDDVRHMGRVVAQARNAAAARTADKRTR